MPDKGTELAAKAQHCRDLADATLDPRQAFTLRGMAEDYEARARAASAPEPENKPPPPR